MVTELSLVCAQDLMAPIPDTFPGNLKGCCRHLALHCRLVLFVRTGLCFGTMALSSALIMTNSDVCCFTVRWQIHHAGPEKTPLLLYVIGQHSFSKRDTLKGHPWAVMFFFFNQPLTKVRTSRKLPPGLFPFKKKKKKEKEELIKHTAHQPEWMKECVGSG